MNADQVEIFGTLRGRIKKIISSLESERKENKKLLIELEQLKSRYEQQNISFKELEHKYNNLKLAKVIASDSNEGYDAKMKVNRIVREIDNCIALLNR